MAKAKRRKRPVPRSQAQGSKAATVTTTTPMKTRPLEIKLNRIVNNENPNQNFENVTVVHGSPSTKTSEVGMSLNCTVCARKITSQTPVTDDDETTFQLLFPLFKLLKISPAVCRFVLKHSSQPVGYCEPCRDTISNGLRISKEIEILRNSLEAITSRVKDDFLEGYYCRARDANEKFSIRKALVQCWTTCRVRINRIEPKNVDTNVGTRANIDFKSHSQIMPFKMTESQHSSHDLCTDPLAPAGLKSDETDHASDIDFDPNEDFAPRSPSPIVSDVSDHLDDCVESEGNISESESASVPLPVRPSPAAKKSKAKKKTPRKIKSKVAPLTDFQDSESVLDSGEIPIEDSNLDFQTKPSKFEDDFDPAEDNDSLLLSSVDPGADVTENISGDDIEEKESGFICRRSLRRRPQKEIPTYLIEIESDGNVSESGSVYSPDSPLLNDEEILGPQETQKERKRPNSCSQPRNKTKIKRSHRTSSGNSCSRPKRNRTNEVPKILLISPGQRFLKFPHHCKTCGKGYHKLSSLRVHEKYHQEGHEEFPCDLCGKAFLSVSQLRIHVSFAHRPKNVSTILQTSAAQKTLKFAYRCKKCGKGYRTRFHFQIHERYHQQGHEEFPCDLCGKSFLSNILLNMHLSQSHPEEWQRRQKDQDSSSKSDADKTLGPLFHCKTCGLGYQCLRTLKNHEKFHQPGQKQFPCDLCEGKSFVSKHHLRRHNYRCHREIWQKQRQANYEKTYGSSEEFPSPHHCKTCGKGYKLSYNLKMHEKTHDENTEKFPCTLCEGKKSFVSEHYLNVHIGYFHKSGALKLDVNPLLESFECSYCSKVYRREDFIDKASGRLKIVCDSDGCSVRWSELLEYSTHHGLTCPKKLELVKENDDASNPNPGPEGDEAKTDGIKRNYCETPPVDDALSADGTTSSNANKPLVKRNGKRLTCKVCGKSGFPNVDYLSRHKNRYHGLQSISCPECDEKFVLTKTAIQHQIRVHGKPVTDVFGDDGSLESFQCVFCLQDFYKEEYLVDDPTSTGTEDEPPKKILKIFVGFCKTPLTDFKAFQWHHLRTCWSRLRLDFGDGEKEVYYSADIQDKKIDSVAPDVSIVAFSHRCDICAKTYDVRYGFDKAGRKSGQVCPMEGCTRQTHGKRQFRCHHSSHHADVAPRSFNCEPCGKVFSETGDAYFLNYKLENKYKCKFDGCQSNYKNFAKFQKHHLAHHSEEGVVPAEPFNPETHLCKYCGKAFSAKGDARIHEINKHTKQFTCYCEICGLGMPSTGKLNAHRKTHSTERPFKCELCPKAFKAFFTLKEHMNFHNGVTPYVCEICGKSFHSNNNLAMHRKAHQKKAQE